MNNSRNQLLLVLSFNIVGQVLKNILPRYILPIVVGSFLHADKQTNTSSSGTISGSDASVSGTISSISVVISLAVLLTVASLVKKSSHSHNWKLLLWAGIAGCFSIASLLVMCIITSIIGWSIMYWILIPSINVTSSLLLSFVVETASTEERSFVSWTSAVFQTLGSLIGAGMATWFEDTKIFLLVAAVLLIFQLIISIVGARSIQLRHSQDQQDHHNQESQHIPGNEHERHLLHSSNSEQDDVPLLSSGSEQIHLGTESSTFVATITNTCGKLPSVNVLKLLASRFCYECALAATMVNLYLLVALTGAKNTNIAKTWSMYSSWMDTICVVVISICAASISDKIGRKPIIYVSCFLYIVAFVGWSFAKGIFVYLCFYLFFGIAHGALKSVDVALLMDTVTTAASKNSDELNTNTQLNKDNKESVTRVVLFWRVSGTIGGALGDWMFGYLWSGESGDSSAVATSGAAILRYTLPACLLIAASTFFVWNMDVEEKAVENITVTGGFFDGTPNGYIGMITVWRRRFGNSVTRLSFKMVKEFVPTLLPVNNKGFGGGSWHNKELWVCWPNRVVAIKPSQTVDWCISQKIDNIKFNDLHDVHVTNSKVYVANSGLETVDCFSHDGVLQTRHWLTEENTTNNACSLELDAMLEQNSTNITEIEEKQRDLRGSAIHQEMRGTDTLHVNHVHLTKKSDSSGQHLLLATCLKTSQVIRLSDEYVHDKFGQRKYYHSKDVAVQLFGTDTTRPHEGFVQTIDTISQTQLIWNSTVDGRVIASDLTSGEMVREWNLKNTNGPRGWHRGLVLLDDGFLVGSTVVRGDAVNWINWNFDTAKSKTGVTFVPWEYENHSRGNEVCSVQFLTERSAKVFSLLRTPDGVH